MSAAPFVRGGVLADIGTDHAYLPARLILDGRISEAVASDIGEGPLRRAGETVKKYGLEEKITLCRADGLYGIEFYRPEDIVIFGMGGELIASIIDAAPWVRNPDVRLILQPMTRLSELREYLLSRGFAIIDEAMSEAGGRIYQTIPAEFFGGDSLNTYSPAELLLGRHNIARGDKLTLAYAAQLADIYKLRRAGKVKSGADTAEEDKILKSLSESVPALFDRKGIVI